MIKYCTLEFAVQNADEAIKYYKEILGLEVVRLVPSTTLQNYENVNKIHDSNDYKKGYVVDSLLKINDSYFKIYEWNEKFDGVFNPKNIPTFNIHLNFDNEKEASQIYTKFLSDKNSKEIIPYAPMNGAGFSIYYGVVQDKYHIKWSIVYKP